MKKCFSRALVALVIALIFWMPSPAWSDPVFNAATTCGQSQSFCGAPGTQASGSSPVSVSDSLLVNLNDPLPNHGDHLAPVGLADRVGSATAGPGYLGAYEMARAMHPDFLGFVSAGVAGISNANFTIDDIVFSGPAGSVTTSLNLDFSGSFAASSIWGGTALWNNHSASMGVSTTGNLTGPSFTGFSFAGSLSAGVSAPSGGPATVTKSGIFDGFSGGSSTLTTGSFTVPLGVPLTLHIGLQASTFVLFNIGGSSIIAGQPHPFVDLYALSDFANTLSFPMSGQVFNLPEGYTVSSLSGLISNNSWEGGPAPVPEPATLLLLGSGLAGLGLVRRRRQKM